MKSHRADQISLVTELLLHCDFRYAEENGHFLLSKQVLYPLADMQNNKEKRNMFAVRTWNGALNYSGCKAQLAVTSSQLPQHEWMGKEGGRGGKGEWKGATEADRGVILGAPDQTSASSWGSGDGRDSGAGGGPKPEGQTPARPAQREAPPAAGLHGARLRALRDEKQSRERGRERESTVEREEEQEEW